MTNDRLQDRLRAYAAKKTWPAVIAMLRDAADRIDELERAPDRDQGTGALGLLLDTATLKTMEAVEGWVYRWDGVRGWVVEQPAEAAT
jgi:hypothetical protein